VNSISSDLVSPSQLGPDEARKQVGRSGHAAAHPGGVDDAEETAGEVAGEVAGVGDEEAGEDGVEDVLSLAYLAP
jgi:hypothetical protein